MRLDQSEDLTRERAALVGLLTSGSRMHWAKLRDRLADGETLPTDLLEDENIIDDGYNVIEQWLQEVPGSSFYCYLDDGFPNQLRTVWDFPPFVFVKGDQAPILGGREDAGICIVGSRKPRPSAIEAARWIAKRLTSEGITIVSGLAEGIDHTVHSVALDQHVRTVGVIGTGIDRYYPASSKLLQQQMETGEGMVLSQFAPRSSPTRYAFPMRNATMSAYGYATIIVEASEKSGTRHQARQAVRHGRPLILLSQVANETTWGRTLVDDPLTDVSIAWNPEEAAELAFGVFDRRRFPTAAEV